MGISYHFVLLYYHPKPFIIRNKYANIPENPVFDLIFLVRNQIDLTVPFRAHEYENSLKSRVFQNHNHKTFLYSVSPHVDLQNTKTSVFCVSNNCSKLVHCNPSSPSDSMNFFSLSNSRNFSFLSLQLEICFFSNFCILFITNSRKYSQTFPLKPKSLIQLTNRRSLSEIRYLRTLSIFLGQLKKDSALSVDTSVTQC